MAETDLHARPEIDPLLKEQIAEIVRVQAPLEAEAEVAAYGGRFKIENGKFVVDEHAAPEAAAGGEEKRAYAVAVTLATMSDAAKMRYEMLAEGPAREQFLHEQMVEQVTPRMADYMTRQYERHVSEHANNDPQMSRLLIDSELQEARNIEHNDIARTGYLQAAHFHRMNATYTYKIEQIPMDMPFGTTSMEEQQGIRQIAYKEPQRMAQLKSHAKAHKSPAAATPTEGTVDWGLKNTTYRKMFLIANHVASYTAEGFVQAVGEQPPEYDMVVKKFSRYTLIQELLKEKTDTERAQYFATGADPDKRAEADAALLRELKAQKRHELAMVRYEKSIEKQQYEKAEQFSEADAIMRPFGDNFDPPLPTGAALTRQYYAAVHHELDPKWRDVAAGGMKERMTEILNPDPMEARNKLTEKMPTVGQRPKVPGSDEESVVHTSHNELGDMAPLKTPVAPARIVSGMRP